MTKIFAATTALALALGAASVASAGKKAPVDQADVKDHKVTICHFPGHDGDREVTGGGLSCEAAGGIILEVSKKGAENGHGVDVD